MGGNQEVKNIILEMQGNTWNFNFSLMYMTRANLFLGCEWLDSLGSSLQHSYQSNTLAFENNGMHIFLLGE